jgi:DNA-directed RNA polymerase subunit RPC12/RpoP
MEVKCNRCSKEHSIPDSSIAQRRIYFFCSQCGHKIIVNGKKSFVKSPSFPRLREHKALPGIKNILGAIPFSFNPISVMMSFIFSISAFTLLFLFALMYYKQIAFFGEYPVIGIFAAIVLLGAIYYGFSILLYLISKLQMKKSETGETGPVNWEFLLFDFKDDCTALLFFSILLPLLFLILLSPIYFLNNYGFIYAAIFSPILFVCAFLTIFSLLLYNFVPAIIASKSLSPLESIINVFLFVRRELINIPFYLCASQIVYFFISSILLFLFGSAIALSLFGIFSMLDPALKANILVFLVSLKSFVAGVPLADGLGHVAAGTVLLIFFLILFLQVLFSYTITLHQSLIAQSCWIMDKNREKSVPGNAVLIILAILVLISCAGFFILQAAFLKLPQF